MPTSRREERAIIKGADCEYIKVSSIASNSGCSNGVKFVLKQETGVRKQFLIMNGEAIIAFINKGKKFTACSSYTEITTEVTCKVNINSKCTTLLIFFIQEVNGLSNVDLSATTTTTTTVAGGKSVWDHQGAEWSHSECWDN